MVVKEEHTEKVTVESRQLRDELCGDLGKTV